MPIAGINPYPNIKIHQIQTPHNPTIAISKNPTFPKFQKSTIPKFQKSKNATLPKFENSNNSKPYFWELSMFRNVACGWFGFLEFAIVSKSFLICLTHKILDAHVFQSRKNPAPHIFETQNSRSILMHLKD